MTENPQDTTADEMVGETNADRLERIEKAFSILSPHRLCGLIRRGALAQIALTILASHRSIDVRIAVAESPETEEDVLHALLRSSLVPVQEAVKKNLAARSAAIRSASEAKPSACASAMADDAKDDGGGQTWAPEGTTNITCGVRCHEKSVSYTTVAWPSGVEVETGTARTVSFLHEALRRVFVVLGTDLKRCVSMVVAEIGGKSKPVAELWYGSTSTPWWSAYLTDSVEGMGWAFKTRGTTILVRVRPRQKRTQEWHLAQLALGLLGMERNPDPAETKVMSPAEQNESSAAWRAMEAGYEGARAERTFGGDCIPLFSDAVCPTPTVTLTLRERLIVEAFKVLLPRSVDQDIDDFGARPLAHTAMQFVDALMAKASESREVTRG